MGLLRNVFYTVFICTNYYLNTFVASIIEQEKCKCKTGWKIENLKVLSQLAIFLGIVNLFIPLNKTLYKIPLVSMFFSYGLLLIIFLEIFLLIRFSRNLRNLKKCKGCNTNGFEFLINNCQNLSMFFTLVISIIVTICLLHL